MHSIFFVIIEAQKIQDHKCPIRQESNVQNKLNTTLRLQMQIVKVFKFVYSKAIVYQEQLHIYTYSSLPAMFIVCSFSKPFSFLGINDCHIVREKHLTAFSCIISESNNLDDEVYNAVLPIVIYSVVYSIQSLRRQKKKTDIIIRSYNIIFNTSSNFDCSLILLTHGYICT